MAVILQISPARGTKVPFVYQAETRSLLPGVGEMVGQRVVVMPDGRLVFVGLQEMTRYNQPGILQATAVKTDGSMPADGFLKTVLHNKAYGASLALSPDGKTFYASDIRNRMADKSKNDPGMLHAVYKFSLDDKDAKVFIGDPAKASDDATHLNMPRGLATDKDGNVYVADPVMDIVLDERNDAMFLWRPRATINPVKAFKLSTGEPSAAVVPGKGAFNAEIGRDGLRYALVGWPNASVLRSDAAGKALPFTGTETFSPEGKEINRSLIDSDLRSLSSVRVDPQGNIYLALGLRPGKDALPPGLKGKVPDDKKDPDAVQGLNCYPMIYGSIAKFGPDGGKVTKGGEGVPCNYAFGSPAGVVGAKWIFSGASNVPSWRTPGTPDICLCESPRFDVDGFGRSFYPDAARFRVGVLDTAGNEICTFGGYGNQDSAGPGSMIPTPEVPFCWVQVVALTEDAAYVGDRLNRRVVKVKIVYATEAVCPIPPTSGL